MNTITNAYINALLADGLITSGRELFGNHTLLKNGWQSAENGFEALKELDAAEGWYRDGVVDNKDAGWASLRVWNDANSNGLTDAGELLTMDAAGVKSLNVAYTEHGNNVAPDAQGNQHRQQGSYITTTDTTRKMDDVWLAVDSARTIDPQAPLTLSDAIAVLNLSCPRRGNLFRTENQLPVHLRGDCRRHSPRQHPSKGAYA